MHLFIAGVLATCASCSHGAPAPVSRRPIATQAVAPAAKQTQSDDLTPPTRSQSSLAGSESDASPGDPSAAPPQRGGTLIAGGLSRPEWANPLWADRYDASGFQSLIFESLLRLDDHDGHLLPGLAESWTVASGAQVITFTLRGGVKWHDGQLFSSRDVAATWRAATVAPASIPHAEHLAWVSDVETEDDRTVVVHLRRPDCAALTQLGLLPILPAHLWSPSDMVQPVSRPSLMVGTGPFILADWETGVAVTLTRHADYWAGEPYLENWAYRGYDTPGELLEAGHAGKLDLMALGRQPQATAGLEAQFRPMAFPTGESLLLLFNQQRLPLLERNVRYGLGLALDRNTIATQAGAGESLLHSILPAPHWSVSPTLQTPPYDPAEARRLLALQDEPISLTVMVQGGTRIREDTALLVAQAYRQVGVQARLEVMEGDEFMGDLFRHDFDVALLAWPFPLDPEQTSLWHSREITPGVGFNFGSYASDEADQLLDAGRIAEGCSDAARTPLYEQLGTLLARDRPADFLVAPSQVVAIDREVVGAAPSPFAGLYWNTAEWSVGRVAQ
jgi:peptide/nickel transport system substrate-binding protein